MAEVNRFCTAPRSPRSRPICVRAKSTGWMASFAPVAVAMFSELTIFDELDGNPRMLLVNPTACAVAEVTTLIESFKPTLNENPALKVRASVLAMVSPTAVEPEVSKKLISPPLARVYTNPTELVATVTPVWLLYWFTLETKSATAPEFAVVNEIDTLLT